MLNVLPVLVAAHLSTPTDVVVEIGASRPHAVTSDQLISANWDWHKNEEEAPVGSTEFRPAASNGDQDGDDIEHVKPRLGSAPTFALNAEAPWASWMPRRHARLYLK